MTSESLFIWVFLPHGNEPVVAARLDIETNVSGTIGHFVYGRSYLDRTGAFSIDPATLPLDERERAFTNLGGFPGVVCDSCPDKWGIKVIDRLDGIKAYPLGYLLMNDPGRAGALAFSTSASKPPAELRSRQFALSELMDAAADVESDRPVEPELLRALHPGTGGARPKCNVVDDHGVWIAKFPSVHDSSAISIPRLEHATMWLARLCGIRTADTRIETVADRDVCLVKRFDRAISNGSIYRKAFISARSVFFADPNYQSVGTGSYGRLSRWMHQRYGCPPEQRQELFRRMVFNVAVRNSDDHELNHGLVNTANEAFELAPAYDIVPILTPHRIHHHALLIGDDASGTVTNLLSNAAAFGLTAEQAREIIIEIESTIQDGWRDVFYDAGLGDEEIRRVEHVFKSIPHS